MLTFLDNLQWMLSKSSKPLSPQDQGSTEMSVFPRPDLSLMEEIPVPESSPFTVADPVPQVSEVVTAPGESVSAPLPAPKLEGFLSAGHPELANIFDLTKKRLAFLEEQKAEILLEISEKQALLADVNNEMAVIRPVLRQFEQHV